MSRRGDALERELRALVGPDGVLPRDERRFAFDATEGRGVRGRPDAVVVPGSTVEVASVVAWCYAHDLAIVPRGGGSGFAGGAVPIDGGVVVALERMRAVRAVEPALWRTHVEAGVTTAEVRRLARENGLSFPPDPGAAEQSLIGGNIATNAGGPHALGHGVTRHWITGLEAVVAPGEAIEVGGPVRKDVAGYDLLSLLVGSEGTLGIVTAAWLRLVPAPELLLPIVAFYPGPTEGCAAVLRVLETGLRPAALEFLDAGALAAARRALPAAARAASGFAVIGEVEGSAAEARALRDGLVSALAPRALAVETPESRAEIGALWRWRDGVSSAVSAERGAKVSEDIVVPPDRLLEAVEGVLALGRRHGLEACNWGHAGDGNLHATFLVDPDDPTELDRAVLAADDLFELAVRLGGSVSGEHGIGYTKRGQLERQWSPRALELHEAVKRAFDPKGLMNPGKKLGREGVEPSPPAGGRLAAQS
jgi:glycolate oxidase subunit GlcD